MITFSNVSLIYPNSERTIIENASFSVNEGEFVLLMGITLEEFSLARSPSRVVQLDL
jgi:ABC-type multidrug transport system fused ATPase/permease subunit